MTNMKSQSLKLVLSYRNSAKKFLYLSIFSVILFWLVLVAFYILTGWREDAWSLVGKILLSSSVPVTIFYRLFFFLRPKVFAQYELYGDHILIVFGKKRNEIKFSAIRKIWISFLSPRFLGGFGIELEDGKKFYFLSMLKNNEQIIYEIEKRRSDLLKSHKLKKYIKTCQTVDVSWERIKSKLIDRKKIVLKFLFMPLVLAGAIILKEVLLDNLPWVAQNFLILILCSFMFCWILLLILNHYEEKIVIEHLIKDKKREFIERDVEFEKKWQRYLDSTYVILIFGLIFSIYLENLLYSL